MRTTSQPRVPGWAAGSVRALAMSAIVCAAFTAQGLAQTPSRAAKRDSHFAMNPNAKWACDRQTATADPVWRGDKQKLTFTFDIHNEGTADLLIHAKGG